MRYGSDFENLKLYWRAGLLTSKYALEHPNVQDFMHDGTLKFDLVISEQFAQESFLMFAYKFGCPFVTIGEFSFRGNGC
jgi:glucuronosyltransferase